MMLEACEFMLPKAFNLLWAAAGLKWKPTSSIRHISVYLDTMSADHQSIPGCLGRIGQPACGPSCCCQGSADCPRQPSGPPAHVPASQSACFHSSLHHPAHHNVHQTHPETGREIKAQAVAAAVGFAEAGLWIQV